MILEQFERETGVSANKIRTVIRTSDRRYFTFPLKKKNGGERLISQPSKKLKFVQRWLARRVFGKFDIHPCAFAYRRRLSISDNAGAHLGKRYLLKMDFLDFFPSISEDRIIKLLHSNKHRFPAFSDEDFGLIAHAVCFREALSIGAPSSPIISNCIMHKYDDIMYEFCHSHDVVYTRYADDLTFSTNSRGVLDTIYNHVHALSFIHTEPFLHVNEKKTLYLSKKSRMTVTGLTLTPQGHISIGRTLKRHLKTMVYLYKEQSLSIEEIETLRGRLAYVHSVEPTFVDSLRVKFGDSVLSSILGAKTRQMPKYLRNL